MASFSFFLHAEVMSLAAYLISSRADFIMDGWMTRNMINT